MSRIGSHHALREVAARGDVAHVNGQAYLVAPVSPATLDALAGIEAEAEDREDDPAEARGDDELAIVSATWARCRNGPFAAGGALLRSGANSPETRASQEPPQRRGTLRGAPTRLAPDSRVLSRLRAVQGAKPPCCHPRCHPGQKRRPPKRPNILLSV